MGSLLSLNEISKPLVPPLFEILRLSLSLLLVLIAYEVALLYLDVMTFPELPPNPPSPTQWVEKVFRSEPHGLDVLEAHVLAYANQADELSKTSWWRIAWDVAPVMVALFGSIGGFAVLVGNDKYINRGWASEPSIGDLPWASLSYWAASIGIMLMVVQWLVRGHRRDVGAQFWLGWIFLFGILGIPFASRLADKAGRDFELEMMTAAFVMMGVAVVFCIVIQFSPKAEPEPPKQPVALSELNEKAMGYLIRERNAAIDIYVRRQLGEGLDAKVLKNRPLGRLHLEE